MSLNKPDSCKSCIGWGWGSCGYVPQNGTGDNGCLVILEAAGEQEAASGIPTVGPAGQYLWNQLHRIGIEREGFRIHNCLSCRPPANKLSKMPYEHAAISHCAPNLDATISEHVTHCNVIGKTPVIIALGKIAFKRLMNVTDRDVIMKKDYIAYPFWLEKYQSWLLGAYHPSFLMQGSQHLTPILTYVFQRALEIASNGITIDNLEGVYLEDPEATTFDSWIKDYFWQLERNPDTFLSYDIETPYKEGKDEAAVVVSDDQTPILRCSFSYRPGSGVSVPWKANYYPGLSKLFASSGPKVGWNSCPTPDQRILTADLQWILASDLKVGDKLVGVDEEVPVGYRIRRFNKSVVTNMGRGHAEVFEVGFSNGYKVKVTGNHPWLIVQTERRGERIETGSKWITTIELKVGQRITRYFEPWTAAESRDSGYLAGFFDGEGHSSFSQNGTHNNWMVGITQNEGPTLNFILDLLKKFDCVHITKPASPNNGECCYNIYINGGTAEKARILGSIRPQRLLSKFQPEHLGSVKADGLKVTITSIESLGIEEIVRLSTNTHTYILEGFVAHNSQFDDPKIREYFPLNGDCIDGMLSWHVLNSSFPKSLGFVTPFYAQTMSMWKHLDKERPAFYNSCDADAALRCWLGIREDLKRNQLWHVFNRHVIDVHRVFKFMSDKGVVLDQQMRREAEIRLTGLLAGIKTEMEAAIPLEARRLKVYKKTPKDTAGMLQVEQEAPVKRCPCCHLINPKKAHFKAVSAKKAKLGLDNVCESRSPVSNTEKVVMWAKPIDWKVSKLGLGNYQKAVKHSSIFDKRKGKTSYDESAMMRLIKKYPNDKLYSLILDYREKQKLLSTYLGVTQPNGLIKGGMSVGTDGKIHTQFGSNPNTLRSNSSHPNLQNLPRPANELASLIRNLIVPSPGCILGAADFAGIEAVLVGYDAAAPGYIRLSRRDVHTFYCAYALYELEPGRIPANDLPLLSWDDEKLFSHLEGLKKLLKKERNSLYKHIVHGSNFAQTANGVKAKIFSETGVDHALSIVSRVMDIYFELFPEIKRWHTSVLLQAEKDGYIRNAWGYLGRFSHVFDYEKVDGKWQKRPNPDVGNKVIAFGPQSNAAGIIKEAMMRLFQNRFDEAGQYLRLLIHDELFSDIPETLLGGVLQIMQEEMEKPISEFPLPSSYGMGECLSILTETKSGYRWGSMK